VSRGLRRQRQAALLLEHQLPSTHAILAPWRPKSVSLDPSGYSKRLCTASVPVANVCVGLCVLADVEYAATK